MRPRKPARSWACAWSGILLIGTLASAADPKPAPVAPPKPPLVRQLSEFGDTGAKQLLETCQNAIAELRKTGGVLEISTADGPAVQNKSLPLQGLTRTPEPPGETKRWADQPGVVMLSHNGKSVVVQAAQLVFDKSARNVNTLGDSRPLINLNPKKHLTDGKVIVVGGRTDYDFPDNKASVFEGKDYTTSLVKNPITNSVERKFGGLIRGDKECQWTKDVVGRWFALTVEQAIGPDPFKPVAFRVWTWEDVPGQYPAAILDAANHGATSRYSVVSVAGGPANLDDLSTRHEPKPAWDNVLVVNTAATVGLNFKADFAKAAILFNQPFHEQDIQWHYGMKSEPGEDQGKTGITKAVTAPAQVARTASLKVNRESGEFQFEGGGLRAGGAVSGVEGHSGDAKPAKNLRGKNIAAVRATTMHITFPTPEADADYAVFIEQSWLCNRAVSEKTAEGFTVTFDRPAPEKATLDWMLVR